MRRSRMPVREVIHSSDVSKSVARSVFESTAGGKHLPQPVIAALLTAAPLQRCPEFTQGARITEGRAGAFRAGAGWAGTASAARPPGVGAAWLIGTPVVARRYPCARRWFFPPTGKRN